MDKKIIICIIIVIIIIIVGIFLFNNTNNKQKNELENNNNNNKLNVIELDEANNISQSKEVDSKEEKIDMIKIKVNNNILEVKLEDNEATKSLVEKLKDGDIIVNAKEYGGFEKVGDLGISLPKSDKNITTSEGDLVLYQGNQISLFYNSNSWNYTKLGRVENINAGELKDILGSGDVRIVLSLN